MTLPSWFRIFRSFCCRNGCGRKGWFNSSNQSVANRESVNGKLCKPNRCKGFQFIIIGNGIGLHMIEILASAIPFSWQCYVTIVFCLILVTLPYFAGANDIFKGDGYFALERY